MKRFSLIIQKKLLTLFLAIILAMITIAGAFPVPAWN